MKILWRITKIAALERSRMAGAWASLIVATILFLSIPRLIGFSIDYAISEGANMPTSPAAYEILSKAGILFGPAKAANAGGVAVSGLEMSQNNMGLSWARDEVDQRLRQIMKDIHSQCTEFGSDADNYVNYVKGANIGGFIKVADAMIDQGVV